jgi:cytochrome c
MKLYDAGKIIAGIVIFLILITFPLWYGKGKAVAPPDLELNTPAIQQLADKRCVEDTAFMRANHMKLLATWRDDVVRDGKRFYTASDGRIVEMSLTGSCLKCHSNKDRFCDRCHDYAGVKPTCWNCHIVPGEVK